jgi:hypothetical protein
MANLINFKNSIISNGGASYNLLNGEFNPTNGYMVSIKGHELSITYNTKGLQYNISQYIKSKADILISGLSEDKFLGAWLDNELLYLDISILVTTENEAIQLAKENNQLAYFNNSTKESIFI